MAGTVSRLDTLLAEVSDLNHARRSRQLGRACVHA
jgi:hypothetical protein